MKLCPNCHTKTESGTALFCEKCGTKLITPADSPLDWAEASFLAGKYSECIGTLRKQMKQGSDEAKRLYSRYLDDSEVFRRAVEVYEYSQHVQSSLVSPYSASADPSSGPGLLFQNGEEALSKGSRETAFGYFKKAAEQGHVKAQSKLGECYFRGWGVMQNLQEAVSWYRKAAERGDADAQCELGKCYLRGRGVEKNEKIAINWYSRAAEQGNAKALFKLGECYFNGKSVPKDTQKALGWYGMAAKQGNRDAQIFVAECYYNGCEGIERNVREAVKWYKMAAIQGDLSAQCKLGECYFYGKDLKKNIDEAVIWYKMAADQDNLEAKLIVDAVNLWKNAAAQNNQLAKKPIDCLEKLMREILNALKQK